MPEVENIRDLLVHVLGQELRAARTSGALASRYPRLNDDEATVGWVLDGMTRHSLGLLMQLREAQGWQ
jgi:hypothetical protein